MASACVNNAGVTPGKFSAYGWLSPRVSFSRDDDTAKSKSKAKAAAAAAARENKSPPSESDLDEEAAADFEFCLEEDPAAMLPADELISDGKLMPMQVVSVTAKPAAAVEMKSEAKSTLEMNAVRTTRIAEVSNGGGGDPYLFSPKAPRCTTRWKEILGLKQNTNSSGNGSANKLLKSFLHRTSKSSTSSSSASSSLDPAGLSLPLLRDSSDCESLSVSSSRLSLSSSSSGHHDNDDFIPRLSLDAEKQTNIIKPISLLKGVAGAGWNPNNPNPNVPRLRLVRSHPVVEKQARSIRRAATEPINATSLGPSVDSPRMNPSGKIVFQSLERSSSSPSSFNGGRPRFVKHSGMERSYSANVRVASVLNVPVCSLRGSSSKSGGGVFGLGQLFGSSHHKRNDSNGGSGSSSRGSSYQQVTNDNNHNNSASISRSSRSSDRA